MWWILDSSEDKTAIEKTEQTAANSEDRDPLDRDENDPAPGEVVSLDGNQLAVSGRIVDAAGAGLKAIGIHLAREDGSPLAEGETDSQGAFTLAVNAYPLPRIVVAESPGWMPRIVVLPEAKESNIDTGDIVLEPAGRVDIRVTAEGARPPASLSLTLLDEKGSLRETTAGKPDPLLSGPSALRALLDPKEEEETPLWLPFSWTAMPLSLTGEPLRFTLPVGTWRLRVEAAGRSPFLSDPFEIFQGSTTRLVFELPAAGIITGICRDLRGAPIKDVEVVAFPVLLDDEGDYTVLQEHLLPAKGGATETAIVRTRSEADGTFRFGPLPEDFWYEIWSSDPDFRQAEFSAGESPAREIAPAFFRELLDSQIVPVNTNDVLLVLDKVPELILTVAAEDEGGLGPGPGNAYVHTELKDRGWSNTFPLLEEVTTLPIRMSRTIPEGDSATVSVQVFWQPDRFGKVEMELPWHARTIAGTAIMHPGFRFDLGSVPFPFNQVVSTWLHEGRTISMSNRDWEDNNPFPRLSDPWTRPWYLLDRDEPEGSIFIVSPEPGLEWAVLWETDYRKLLYASCRIGQKGPEVAERKLLDHPEKMVFRLDDREELFAGLEIEGSVEARLPGLCDGRRLAYWSFRLDPEPGAAPVIWPAQAYTYKPAPNATATLWRPRGIECKVAAYASTEDHRRKFKLLEESFVLSGPREFLVTMP